MEKKKKIKPYILKNGTKVHNFIFNRKVQRNIFENKYSFVFTENFQNKAIIKFKNRKAYFYLINDEKKKIKFRQCSSKDMFNYLKYYIPRSREAGKIPFSLMRKAKLARLFKLISAKARKHKLVIPKGKISLKKSEIEIQLYFLVKYIRENEFYRQNGFNSNSANLLSQIRYNGFYKQRMSINSEIILAEKNKARLERFFRIEIKKPEKLPTTIQRHYKTLFKKYPKDSLKTLFDNDAMIRTIFKQFRYKNDEDKKESLPVFKNRSELIEFIENYQEDYKLTLKDLNFKQDFNNLLT